MYYFVNVFLGWVSMLERYDTETEQRIACRGWARMAGLDPGPKAVLFVPVGLGVNFT